MQSSTASCSVLANVHLTGWLWTRCVSHTQYASCIQTNTVNKQISKRAHMHQQLIHLREVTFDVGSGELSARTHEFPLNRNSNLTY